MPSTAQIIAANLASLGFINPSAAAVENEIAQSLGVPVDNTITEMANSQSIINQTIAAQNYGKAGYYTSIALAFQYGYSLSKNTAVNPYTGVAPLNLYYATIDTSAQIISQAAFVNNSGSLFLKVATLNTMTNLLQALSSGQLAAFTSYFLNFELPGLPVGIVSIDANILNFNAVATYLSSYDLPTLQTNIYNALVSFRDTFQFNGVLYITQLEAYMVANVPGLISFFTSSQTIDSSPIVGGNVVLSSGYFNYFSALLDNPSSQITYTGV